MTFKQLSPLAFVFVAFACSEDPVTTIDRAADCADICGRYEDCVGGDDTDGCNDRCTDMTNKRETARIDTCEECLDGKSCTGSVFNCTVECAGIVVP